MESSGMRLATLSDAVKRSHWRGNRDRELPLLSIPAHKWTPCKPATRHFGPLSAGVATHLPRRSPRTRLGSGHERARIADRCLRTRSAGEVDAVALLCDPAEIFHLPVAFIVAPLQCPGRNSGETLQSLEVQLPRNRDRQATEDEIGERHDLLAFDHGAEFPRVVTWQGWEVVVRATIAGLKHGFSGGPVAIEAGLCARRSNRALPRDPCDPGSTGFVGRGEVATAADRHEGRFAAASLPQPCQDFVGHLGREGPECRPLAADER